MEGKKIEKKVKATYEEGEDTTDGIEFYKIDVASAICPYCGYENNVYIPPNSTGGDGTSDECEHFSDFDGEYFYFKQKEGD